MSISQSWLPIEPSSPFSLANIPFGIISKKGPEKRVPAVAIGSYALDLFTFAQADGFCKLHATADYTAVFSQPTLNAFAALGRKVHGQVRRYLQEILAANSPFPEVLRDNKTLQESSLVKLVDIQVHLPLEIGDYTDFFAGKNHAFNVGTLFRGPQNALQPNYTHVPVAYHGRASSVVISGTPIRRPSGQILTNPKEAPNTPSFLPCRRLDIELELGMFICKANDLGTRVTIGEARDYIFGYVLMNDWSARDIQQWEYVPLGPFIAKNFGTTISGWVVLAEALEPSACHGIENESPLQKYLEQGDSRTAVDINLTVDLKCKPIHCASLCNITLTTMHEQPRKESLPPPLPERMLSIFYGHGRRWSLITPLAAARCELEISSALEPSVEASLAVKAACLNRTKEARPRFNWPTAKNVDFSKTVTLSSFVDVPAKKEPWSGLASVPAPFLLRSHFDR